MKNALQVLIDNYIDGDLTELMTAEQLRDYRDAYNSDDENHRYSHEAVTTIEMITQDAAFRAGIKAAMELFAK